LEPAFAIWLGDYIYVDHPKMKGVEVDMYRDHYRFQTDFPSALDFAKSIPMASQIDDHEIDDNWYPGRTDCQYCSEAGLYANAMQAFNEYLGKINPVTYSGKTYYTFDYGDSAFFVIDIRSYRTGTSMLGADQLAALKTWIKATGPKWKFIASPAPLSGNFECSDCWQGFMTERKEILDHIEAAPLTHNVVFLSGDRHWTYVSKMRDGIYEFSTSPLGCFSGHEKDPMIYQIDSIEWMDISQNGMFEGASMFYSLIDVDSTGDGSLTIKTYMDKDTTKPIFTATVAGGSGTTKTKMTKQATPKVSHALFNNVRIKDMSHTDLDPGHYTYNRTLIGPPLTLAEQLIQTLLPDIVLDH
jgi:hypothetical protein